MKYIMPRRARTASGLSLVGLILACTPAEQQQDADGLASDMQLYAVKDLMARPALLAEVNAVCDKLKASQRPPMSFPAVVINNCNNADSAKQLELQRKDREQFKRGMGIE